MADNSAQIAQLEIAETKVLEAMATNAATEEFEIRGRRVRFRDLPKTLMDIRKLIAMYRNQQNGRSLGTPTRSRTRLKHN